MAVILSPGDHWPSDTLVHNTPLLSGFKKTKLKHGAVCLTSLVFRHLRFGQGPGVEYGMDPPSSLSNVLLGSEAELESDDDMQRITATVIAW